MKAMKNSEYKGHKFSIDNNYRFVVPDLDITAESFALMQEAVDKKQKHKEATAREKLCIPAMWVAKRKIIEGVITGVHAGHGHLVTNPLLGKYAGIIYPRVGWLKMALAEVNTLESRAAHIKTVLAAFQVEGYSRYNFDSEMHSSEVKRIANEMAKVKESAEATSLEEELKTTPAPKSLEL